MKNVVKEMFCKNTLCNSVIYCNIYFLKLVSKEFTEIAFLHGSWKKFLYRLFYIHKIVTVPLDLRLQTFIRKQVHASPSSCLIHSHIKVEMDYRIVRFFVAFSASVKNGKFRESVCRKRVKFCAQRFNCWCVRRLFKVKTVSEQWLDLHWNCGIVSFFFCDISMKSMTF